MEVASKSLIYLLKRVWNKDLDKENEWKGSWPEWRWTDNKTPRSWLEGRRQEEGAENLWRVHDKLYDLEGWAKSHPGGPSWISMTKGTDITESFESYHLTGTAEAFLPKFYVREAKAKRNSPFTFHDGGFFRVLKAEVRNHLETHKASLKYQSNLLTDGLFVSTLLFAVLSASYSSYTLCFLSGILLCFLTVCGHNYFHQRDNFRMYYFNLALLSFRDWRVTHALSHHLFPNTRYDLEVTMLYPFLQLFPKTDKTFFTRYVSWIYSPIAYTLIFHKQCAERLLTNPDGWVELLPLVFPISMVILGGASILQAVLLWQMMTFTASFFFGLIGVSVAHHHPDIFHDGDHAREDMDWGLYQIDAVWDRLEIKGSLTLVMITFGDHTMHHLFPTLDHSQLDDLYPILLSVCKKFGYDFTFSNQVELFKGQFQQLARVEPKNNVKPLTPATS